MVPSLKKPKIQLNGQDLFLKKWQTNTNSLYCHFSCATVHVKRISFGAKLTGEGRYMAWYKT